MQASALFAAMRSNQVAPFGLVRLSAYDLNEVYSCAESAANQPRTLIERAAELRCDLICAALLRAGADPSVSATRPRGPETISPLVRHLWQWPPAFAVWAIRVCVALRHAAEPNAAGSMCPCCMQESGQSLLAAAAQCNHRVCENCFWERSVTQARDFGELCCAHADCGVQVVPRDAALAATVRPLCAGQVFGDVANESEWPEASEIRQRSLERWLQLPVELASDCALETRKPRFCALPRARLAALFCGSIRAQRVAELEKAALAGNALRIQALIAAGVDIDARNEYGQSALILAAWQRHALCVRLLLRCGADSSARDNAGVGVWQLARAAPEVTDELLAYALPDSHVDSEAACATLVPLTLADVHLPCSTLPDFQPPHCTDADGATLHMLIAPSAQHAGAGSFVLDNAFDERVLQRLEALHARLPRAVENKPSCSERAYYCDSLGWVRSFFLFCECKSILEILVHLVNLSHPLEPHVRYKTLFPQRWSVHTAC